MFLHAKHVDFPSRKVSASVRVDRGNPGVVQGVSICHVLQPLSKVEIRTGAAAFPVFGYFVVPLDDDFV